jgi:hypothetical protein
MYNKYSKKLVVLFPDCNNIIFYGRTHSDVNYSSPTFLRIQEKKCERDFGNFIFPLQCYSTLSSRLGVCDLSVRYLSTFVLLYGRKQPEFVFRNHQGAH